MTTAGAVVLRTLVTAALAWLVGWLVSLTSDDAVGADLGPGLAAFTAVLAVALVWSFVDARRRWTWVRTVLVWLVVGALLGLVAALTAQGLRDGIDTSVLVSDRGFVPFATVLTGLPAVIGAGLGRAARPH